ncbi:type II CAAX endopeptidase family protein [Lactobacillus sp. ESL0679]|uniref:CPBP family intramembrane glutamic endopeptidase n=1 Tax=Lactobacillus sp. ESL0679 TaxID=2983209 RepID=UPI0023F69A21|nr:type II CAAX endopeptidase family protein [Lactobacillus sp. ESL0679]MDF7682440.1 type II CAAX endopeptidase family protein [Lactobacillus sp. ESL0679]
MKKLFNWLGNIAGIILAFASYQILEYFYFFPHQLEKLLHINYVMLIILTAIATILVLAFILYLYQRQLKIENNWGFNQSPHWDGHRLLIMLFSLILIVVCSYTLQILLGVTSQNTSANQATLDKISLQAGGLFIPMVCIIAPICEETIFRGLFFNTFFMKESKISKWLGIIFSGFVFGYMHDPSITKFIIIYWALGCILAWVYTSTKDLRYSMLTHMFYNSLPYLLIILDKMIQNKWR